MNYWHVEKEWLGETVAVLASGPSMNKDVAQRVRDSGVHTIAVNNQGIPTNGYEAMAPWADVLCAGDYSWWFHNKEECLKFAGRKVSIDNEEHRWTPDLLEAIVFLRHGGVVGFDDRPEYIRSGGNSGFFGVHLALKLGAARVIMCGFDMHGDNGQHWFGAHAWRRNSISRYDIFLDRFAASVNAFKRQGEVINATPNSALKCFRSMSLSEALNGVRSVRGKTTKSKGSYEEKHSGAEAADGFVSSERQQA